MKHYLSLKQRGFPDDLIIKCLWRFTFKRNVRLQYLPKRLCGTLTQKMHLFYGSITVPMLIWIYKHAWLRSFQHINPLPAGSLVSFVDGRDSLRRLRFYWDIQYILTDWYLSHHNFTSPTSHIVCGKPRSTLGA